MALTPDTRILDVGATSVDVARDLASRGMSRYLGITPQTALAGIRSGAGELSSRFHALNPIEVVLRCSADLLILRAPHLRALWAIRDVSHFRLLAVERVGGRSAAERRLATLLARYAAQVERRGRVHLGGRAFDLLQLHHSEAQAVRRYLSPAWGPAGMAQRLRAAGIRYVVLRWFDSLPDMAPGEDLDILVADEDLDRFRALLSQEPGTIPVDLYSVSGLPYSDYHEAAYYPPDLARVILDGARTNANGFRVPNPQDHLHSLAYHAVYHKGLRSGIPSESSAAEGEPEHEYQAILSGIAHRQGIEPPATLEGWDAYLASAGWQPPADALRKLVSSNTWLASAVVPTESPPSGYGELAVFLIRAQTKAVVSADEILEALEHFGFDVLVGHDLTLAAQDRAAAAVRGGNWGPGPFPRSGGPPAQLLVATHYAPGELWEEIRHRYPHLTNADVLGLKWRLRDMVLERVGPDAAFNPVHSADNESEAWEYLRVIAPELIPEIRAASDERRSHLEIRGTVLRNLSRGRRARVDVVEGDAGPVVRKTYAPRFARHLEREIEVMDQLHGTVDAVPPVLERGPNWFTCPYFDNKLGTLESGRLLPLGVLRAMVEALRELHEQGFDLVDAKPQNFLLDRRAGLKVVDFEFARRYGDGPRPRFVDTMNFEGLGPDYRGDVPVGDQSYEQLWLPYTGMPRHVLVDGSISAQRAHRALYRLRRTTIAPGSPLRRPLRRIREAGRHLRWLAGRRFRRWARARAGTAP